MTITTYDIGTGKNYYEGLSSEAVLNIINQDVKVGDLVTFSKSGRHEDHNILGVVTEVYGTSGVNLKSVQTGVTMYRDLYSITLIPNAAERIQQFKLDNPELFI